MCKISSDVAYSVHDSYTMLVWFLWETRACMQSCLFAMTHACMCSCLLLSQEFSEWAQCQVLEFASHYRPSDEQEVYDFMNVLDDRLSHSNSAVVMATVKMFLHYTLSMPATHQQVL